MTVHPPSPSISIEAALRDSASKNDRARAAAAYALGSVEDPDYLDDTLRALLRLLSDERPAIRATAALSIADAVNAAEGAGAPDNKAVVEALAGGLDDAAPDARQACAIALGKLGDPAGFAPLAEKLADAPPDLRFQAATSLVEIDPERAFEPLFDAIEHETDAEVQAALCLGLGEIGDRRAIPRMLPVLDSDRAETRFDAAYALSQLGEHRSLGVLAGFLDQSNLAWDAILALESAGAPEAAASLAQLVARRFAPRVLRLRAAAAILKLAPGSDHAAEARRVLIAGTTAWKHQHRALAVELLGDIGGPWAEAALRALQNRRAGRSLHTEIDSALTHIRGRAE